MNAKMKFTGSEKAHREAIEVLSTYFSVVRETKLLPTGIDDSTFFAYYLIGTK